MKSLRQLLSALLVAVLSLAIVIGALSMALVEGGVQQLTFHPSETPTVTLINPTGSEIPATEIPALTTTITPSSTSHAPVTCPPPLGWVSIILQSSDTLPSLAQLYNTSVDILMKGNCLVSQDLFPGAILYIPLQGTNTPILAPSAILKIITIQYHFTSTSTSVPCSPPAGWIIYIVKSGDNLFRIGLAYGVHWTYLQAANCMSTSEIYVGQRLYVPNVPTITPKHTKTPQPPPPPTRAPTATPIPPTSTPIPPTATPTEVTPPTSVPATETPTNTQVTPDTPTPTSTSIIITETLTTAPNPP